MGREIQTTKLAIVYTCLIFSSMISTCLLQPISQLNSFAFDNLDDPNKQVQGVSWAQSGTGSQSPVFQQSTGQLSTAFGSSVPVASQGIAYPNTVAQVPYQGAAIQTQYPQTGLYPNSGSIPYQSPVSASYPYPAQAQYPANLPYANTGINIPYPPSSPVSYPAYPAPLPVARGYSSGFSDDSIDYSRRQIVDANYWTGTAYPQYPQSAIPVRPPTFAGYQSSGFSQYGGYSSLPTPYSGYAQAYSQYPAAYSSPAVAHFNPQYWTGIKVPAPMYPHPAYPVPAYHPGYPQVYQKKGATTKKLLGAALVGALAGKVISKVG